MSKIFGREYVLCEICGSRVFFTHEKPSKVCKTCEKTRKMKQITLDEYEIIEGKVVGYK